MRTNWISIASIALSALTLAFVVSLAQRPAAGGPAATGPAATGPAATTPAATGPDAASALGDLSAKVDAMRTEIGELRSIARSTPGPDLAPDLAAIRGQLDGFGSLVVGINAKLDALVARVDAICRMVNSSPFVPSGGGC